MTHSSCLSSRPTWTCSEATWRRVMMGRVGDLWRFNGNRGWAIELGTTFCAMSLLAGQGIREVSLVTLGVRSLQCQQCVRTDASSDVAADSITVSRPWTSVCSYSNAPRRGRSRRADPPLLLLSSRVAKGHTAGARRAGGVHLVLVPLAPPSRTDGAPRACKASTERNRSPAAFPSRLEASSDKQRAHCIKSS